MTLMSTKYSCQKKLLEAIFFSYKRLCEKRGGIYWVIQNDCGQVWQLCTKMYVASV
jgi:hypothetical protein